jgi:hypothetical protein
LAGQFLLSLQNEEPRGKPRGFKSESGQSIRRKRRGIRPEGIKLSGVQFRRVATQRIPSGIDGKSLNKNPDVWLQSLPLTHHRLKAWQMWASMYGNWLTATPI